MGDQTGRHTVLPRAVPPETTDTSLQSDAGGFTLWFEDGRPGGRRTGIRFEGVRAYRYRAEGHCTGWHTGGMVDALVEADCSEWVEELRAIGMGHNSGHWEMHHYILCPHDSGSYEVVAKSWACVPDEPKPR